MVAADETWEGFSLQYKWALRWICIALLLQLQQDWFLHQNVSEQCVAMHTGCLCLYRPGLYKLCLCMCLSVWQSTYSSRGVLLKDYHWGGRLSGAQKSVFFPWLGASQPPSFSHLSALLTSILLSFSSSSFNEMRRGGLLSAWGTVALLSAGAVYRRSLSDSGPSCRIVTVVRGWDVKTWPDLLRGEIKHGTQLIWHHYLHGISPLAHRQVSQLDQI